MVSGILNHPKASAAGALTKMSLTDHIVIIQVKPIGRPRQDIDI